MQEIVDKSGIREGSVVVYVPHTTMAVVVNHNEPMLMQDFMRVLYRLVPMDDRYSHDLFELKKGNKSDGRSNGHSHCKSLLLGTSQTIPLDIFFWLVFSFQIAKFMYSSSNYAHTSAYKLFLNF